MPSSPAGSSALSNRMDKGFDEIKALFSKSEDRLRSIEQCHPVLENNIKTLRADVDENDQRIKLNEKAITTLMAAYRVQVFLGSALIVSIIGLIWALITGQAEVTFR